MPVIKLRGLPWSCTEEDIIKFLSGVTIVHKSLSEQIKQEDGGMQDENPEENGRVKPAVYLTMNSEGRPSGEAFIEVEAEADVDAAMARHNSKIGQRYIEVFKSEQTEMLSQLKDSLSHASNWQDPVVRLRGLPYNCKVEEVQTFFTGLNIVYDGILMVIDFSGRFNGEAFVRFASMGDAHKALDKHKEKIGSRYIEVFRSTVEEMEYYSSNTNQDDGFDDFNGGGGGYNKRGGNKLSAFGAGNNRAKPYSRNPPAGNMNGRNQRGGGFQDNNGNGAFGIKSLMNDFGDTGFDFGNNGGGFGAGGGAGFDRYRMNGGGGGGGGNIRGLFDDFDDSGDNDEAGFSVKMRGLPFNATEADVRKFFAPLEVASVSWVNGRDRRPSGECLAYFDTEDDVAQALTYNKKYMGSRYIEIFEHKERRGGGGGSGGSNGGGSRRGITSLMDNEFEPPFRRNAGGRGAGGNNGFGNGNMGGFDAANYPHMNEPELAEVAKKFFASAFVQFQQQKPYPAANGGGGGGYGGGMNGNGAPSFNPRYNRKY